MHPLSLAEAVVEHDPHQLPPGPGNPLSERRSSQPATWLGVHLGVLFSRL